MAEIVEPEEGDIEDNLEIKILGVVLGTASGWDSFGDNMIGFINPKLTNLGKIFFGITDEIPNTVAFDWTTGLASAYYDVGEENSKGFTEQREIITLNAWHYLLKQ